MVRRAPRVVIKDSTLREGLDTPNVHFTAQQVLAIAQQLAAAGVPELEVVAPSRVLDDLSRVQMLRSVGVGIRTSGLIYAGSPRYEEEVEQASECLDRVDLLMPLSEKREPYRRSDKVAILRAALAHSDHRSIEMGVGFPHSTQADPAFLLKICREAVDSGARRVTIYDTNGSGDPFGIRALIECCVAELGVPLFFHGHNDLGLATANCLAAVVEGAAGLDATVNGLGDRAGNASLEQVVMLLHLRGYESGISLQELRAASRLVEAASQVQVSKLAPVIGEYVLSHRSPSHLMAPEQFEAFDPALIGRERRLER